MSQQESGKPFDMRVFAASRAVKKVVHDEIVDDNASPKGRPRRADPLREILLGDLPKEDIPQRDDIYVTDEETLAQMKRAGIKGFRRSHKAGGEAIPVYEWQKDKEPEPGAAPPPQRLYTLHEAASLLGMKEDSLRRYVAAHKDRYPTRTDPRSKGKNGRPFIVLTEGEVRAIRFALAQNKKSVIYQRRKEENRA